MTFKRQTMRFAAGLAAVALVAGACGSDDSSSDGDGATSTEAPDGTDAGGDDMASGECETANNQDDSVASLTELDFSGLDLNVGSKDFVEQFVLGQLAIVALEAGGANVTDSTNLGGTVVNRDAMLSNQIDMYFEYNGTGWTNHLALPDPSFDPVELTNGVCAKDLAENDVRWIGVAPFNNTYGFATAGDSPAAGLDLQGMMEYVNDNPDATVCMETEYPNREDGLVLLEQATGLTVPAGQEQILETGVIFDETASGNCTFGEIYTTDGRIPALGLDVVDDPGVHILYNVSLTMPDSVYQQAPEAFEALADTILAGLDNDTSAELQRQVSQDGEDPRDVAEAYLTEQGLL
ncbi:MAG TPA: glycine betaine ABC transporter substrate-binding protein [Ilumatobacteraceae bacterium]|nr:glycine betaine ABC transporter substrate-binding protein [Ilumatobacteraceae bacterium]